MTVRVPQLLALIALSTTNAYSQQPRGVVPTGACCNPDNSCSDSVMQTACETAGGIYRGDGSACAGVSCGGACCFGNGVCMITSQFNCLGSYGSYADGAPCSTIEPCPICQPEDPENRDLLDGPNESCFLGDTNVNPGCTTGGPGTLDGFTPITCNQTVCAGAEFNGAFRDLDWYHISVAQETEMLITVENGLLNGGRLLFRFRYYPNQQIPPAGTGNGTPCDTLGAWEVVPVARGNLLPAGETVIPIVVPAGRYTMLVAYDFNTPGAPVALCPSNYRVTFDCAAAACAYQCDPGAINAENEPACGNPTQTNNGCSVIVGTGPFTPLPLNHPLCGNSSLTQTSGPGGLVGSRDADWYSLNVPGGELRLRFQAEFHALLFLRPLGSVATPVCTNPDTFAYVILQCSEVEIDLGSLAPGDYGLFVAPDFASYAWMVGNPATAAQELCPAPYQLELTNGVVDCGCGDSNCDGFTTVGDIGFFVDAVVGGQTAWANRFLPGVPTCDFLFANDANCDGFVTVGDIGAFVSAVTGTPCP